MGGRTYGYSTVLEPKPEDPEQPRSVMVIDEREAEVVRRVYRWWISGWSHKRIAATLNEEGVPAPHDGKNSNKDGRGWGHTTIREMLLNERYLGRVLWDQSKWVCAPGKKSRRRIPRPPSEWIVRVRPELAIVSQEVWDAAQARGRRGGKPGRGRPHGTGKHASLLTGLLRCGKCNGSMIVVTAG